MPVLNWIGKDKVVNHDKELPFRVLKPVKELSVGENSENLLIEGDNLEALKALMPFYYGKVKCIYIDPPYNTGNEGWVYNDRVNAPQIKSWLNKVVGAEGEDLCRHDKWLCMMYPRIRLLRDLLSENGVLFVSINDYEVHNLRVILDEIFGADKFLGMITWKARVKPVNIGKSKFKPQKEIEYVLVYEKVNSKADFFPLVSGSIRSYPYELNNRKYRLATILKSNRGANLRPTMVFKLNEYSPPEGQRWQASKQEIERLFRESYIEFKEGTPFRRYFEDEEYAEHDPFYCFMESEFSSTSEAGKIELSNVIGVQHGFDTVKPIQLIKTLIKTVVSKDGNEIILDSFAGSGTSGHAVMELNKEDAGNRKFILVELEKDIAKNVTAKRLKKVAEGYEKGMFPQGTGQGFQYLDLNGELYNQSGFVNPNAQYEDMAAYVYFTETKNYLDIPSIKSPYIGSQGSTHYFLFFEGKDNNILDEKTLKITDGYEGNKVIYADKCLLDEEYLAKKGVIFKQIPYELKKY